MVSYYVYIIEGMRTSKKNYGQIVYYTGMTSDPKRRLLEHKMGIGSNYMKRNKIIPKYFVYIEQVNNYKEAINREKQIKNMSLSSKLALITDYSNK